MADIKTGVTLSLKDLFSQNIHKAAGAASGFANKTLGAIEKVDKALSGTAAKLAAFGLTLSVGAAAKGIIEMDHRMARLGLTANASAEQVSKMKQAIFNAAQLSDIKLDPTNILAGLEVVMTKTGDLKYAEENIKNIGFAIQASGESGDAIGSVFAEFQKFGYSAEQISALMDDMVAQSDQGAFTFAEFAKAAPAVFSAYSAIGTAPENIRKANAAMQILVAGTKSPEIAVTALNSAMAELSDPEKQKKLRQLGIRVRDSAGNFRDFNDIMFDIVNKANQMGNADFFGTIFGTTSMQAVRSYMTQGERMFESLTNLGDTTGLLQKKASTMAGTLQSNITNLQTAFSKFADSNLSKPLAELTGLLNKLAENPERIQKVFTGIAVGIGAIAAVKGIAGISRLIGSLTQLKSGKVNITESLNMAQAMPVYVTNWGGAPAGGMGLGSAGVNQPGQGTNAGAPYQQTQLAQRTPLTNARNAVQNIKPGQYAGGAALAGIGAAVVKIPAMFDELETIKQNDDLSEKEKGKAKGGAIGDATGSIVGAAAGGAAGIAAGAAVGAAVGSVVPVLGTAVGALVGAGIGALGMWLSGKAGRTIGEGIGGAITDDDSKPERTVPHRPSMSGPPPYTTTGASPLNNRSMPTRWRGSQYPPQTPVNDLIVTPQGQFSTHPDDYIMAMKNPASLFMPASQLPPQITQTKTGLSPQKVELEGQAAIDVNVNLSGERPAAQINVRDNRIRNMRFNTGHVPSARYFTS